MTTQDQILKLLSHNGPHTCAEIARHLRMSLDDTRDELENMLRQKVLKYKLEGCKYVVNHL